MTITLHWWLIPIAFVVIGIVALFAAKPQGTYDFATPIIATLICLGCFGMAIAFMLGRWLK